MRIVAAPSALSRAWATMAPRAWTRALAAARKSGRFLRRSMTMGVEGAI